MIGLNIWRSVSTKPLERFPLAICDRTSIDLDDLEYKPNVNAPKPFNTHYCKPNDDQRWHYYSKMNQEEALVFLTYDSHPTDDDLFGSPDGSDLSNLLIASTLGVTVLSVDYRLAPEHPIPAPLEDCYAGLAYLHERAEELRVDVSRIGIGGESAGGGLAAALAIKARDAGKYSVCFQALTYPMLDDRTGSEQNPGDPLVGEFVWTRQLNQYGWSRYLADAERAAPQVPARLDFYAGLPPTWMFTATMDLFRDENIDYARRLMEAEVSCDLVVYPGACHGFQMVEGSKISKRYRKDFMEALERGLG